MSQPSGYSLDQLLEWCQDDRLIDGYDRSDRTVTIFRNGTTEELSLSDARSFLKSIFTSTHRHSQTATKVGGNEA